MTALSNPVDNRPTIYYDSDHDGMTLLSRSGIEFSVGGGADSAYNAIEAIYVGSTGNVRMNYDLTVTGGITADNITYTSDKRLKKDIKPVQNALKSLSRLEGVTYTFKDETFRSYGLVAQDVHKVFPELVKVAGNSEENYLGINYSGLMAPMIEAIKELKAENDALKAHNNALEARLDALEEKLR
jgi:hypothetical protein